MKYRAYLLRLSAPKLLLFALGGYFGLVCGFAAVRCLLVPGIYFPWRLSSGSSFRDFQKFATALKSKEPLAAFLWSHLSQPTQASLTNYSSPATNQQILEKALAAEVDSILRSEPLYSEFRFDGITISRQLRETVVETPVATPSPQINRLLLDAAFPNQLPQSHDLFSVWISAARASFERQALQSESIPPFGRVGRLITWTQALAAQLYFAIIISLISFRLLRKRENIAFPEKLAYNHAIDAFEIRFVNLDASDISNLHIRAFVRKRISRVEDELIRDIMYPVKLSVDFEPYTESMMVVALRTVRPNNEGADLTTQAENAISLDTLDDLGSFIVTVAATAVDSGDTVIARKIYRFTEIVVGNYRDMESDLPPNTYGDPQNWRHRHYELFNTVDGLNMPANEWRQKKGRQGMASLQISGKRRIIRFPNEGNAEKHTRRILNGDVYVLPTPQWIRFNATTVIDVGANVGASAALFLSRYPDSRVFCYEPHTANFHDYLKKNLAGFSKVECFNVGLFEKEDERFLYAGETQCLQPSIFQSAEVKKEEGEKIRLKDALAELETRTDSNTLLKIDTEGCELPILRRIEPLLKDIKLIYLEFHSEADRLEVDKLLTKTHGLWSCEMNYCHRGDLCYLHRDLWVNNTDVSRWVITH